MKDLSRLRRLTLRGRRTQRLIWLTAYSLIAGVLIAGLLDVVGGLDGSGGWWPDAVYRAVLVAAAVAIGFVADVVIDWFRRPWSGAATYQAGPMWDQTANVRRDEDDRSYEHCPAAKVQIGRYQHQRRA